MTYAAARNYPRAPKYFPQRASPFFKASHVQIADNPGRNEPGTGEINYPFIFDLLDREGYEGWVGLEYKPKGATSAGLGWLPGRTS